MTEKKKYREVNFFVFTGLQVEVVMGGLPVQDDIAKFKGKKVHILVGSPGRLRQLVQEKHINVASVRLLILDEADRLVDQSYLTDINYIFSSLPKQKQVIMSSATYPEKTKEAINKYLQGGQHICPDIDCILLGIDQRVTNVKHNVNIVKQTKYRFQELLKILSKKPFKQCLIFCNYQARVAEVGKMLKKEKWPAEHLYGQQDQTHRLHALKTLQEYGCRILVATDLAARGIDASNVDLVINFEPPLEWQTYLHRIGRAGRFGSYGTAVTILSEGKEENKFKTMLEEIRGSINLKKLWDGEIFVADVNSNILAPPESSSPITTPLESNSPIVADVHPNIPPPESDSPMSTTPETNSPMSTPPEPNYPIADVYLNIPPQVSDSPMSKTPDSKSPISTPPQSNSPVSSAPESNYPMPKLPESNTPKPANKKEHILQKLVSSGYINKEHTLQRLWDILSSPSKNETKDSRIDSFSDLLHSFEMYEPDNRANEENTYKYLSQMDIPAIINNLHTKTYRDTKVDENQCQIIYSIDEINGMNKKNEKLNTNSKLALANVQEKVGRVLHLQNGDNIHNGYEFIELTDKLHVEQVPRTLGCIERKDNLQNEHNDYEFNSPELINALQSAGLPLSFESSKDVKSNEKHIHKSQNKKLKQNNSSQPFSSKILDTKVPNNNTGDIEGYSGMTDSHKHSSRNRILRKDNMCSSQYQRCNQTKNTHKTANQCFKKALNEQTTCEKEDIKSRDLSHPKSHVETSDDDSDSSNMHNTANEYVSKARAFYGQTIYEMHKPRALSHPKCVVETSDDDNSDLSDEPTLSPEYVNWYRTLKFRTLQVELAVYLHELSKC